MDQIQTIYQRLDRRTRGLLTLVQGAMESFSREEAAEAAASLAYYAFFSIFPFILVLIFLGSYALESRTVQEALFTVIPQVVPISDQFIEAAVDQVVTQRGPVGIAGLIGLMWSASGGFSLLVKHVNRAWPGVESRNPLWRRFYGLGIIVILVVLFLLWFISLTLLDLLPRFLPEGVLGDFSIQTSPLRVFSGLVPLFFTYLMFLALYRWVPNREVPWSAAGVGALVAAVGWEIASNLFSWYLSSGLANFDLVYGSLSAIVSFLLWVYISSLILLFGAHFGGAVAARQDGDQREAGAGG